MKQRDYWITVSSFFPPRSCLPTAVGKFPVARPPSPSVFSRLSLNGARSVPYPVEQLYQTTSALLCSPYVGRTIVVGGVPLLPLLPGVTMALPRPVLLPAVHTVTSSLLLKLTCWTDKAGCRPAQASRNWAESASPECVGMGLSGTGTHQLITLLIALPNHTTWSTTVHTWSPNIYIIIQHLKVFHLISGKLRCCRYFLSYCNKENVHHFNTKFDLLELS